MNFSDQDHDRIRQAVTEAERHTRGEIVPMIVGQSARYQEARYQAGIGMAFVVLTIFFTMDMHGMGWGRYGPHALWILPSVCVAYGIGYLAGITPPGIRLLTSQERMRFKVRLRAHQAFQEHGLHRTELGTGVLILVSLLEHRIEILTDGPILARVPQETWDRMLSLIQEGFQKGRGIESLCQAIVLCGKVLAEYFPADHAGPNPNELPNTLIPQ